MTSQWAAVGAETDPLKRAGQVHRSWERLLVAGALDAELRRGATAGLRPTIVVSWRRSLATGLDPTNVLAPIEADESEVFEPYLLGQAGSHGSKPAPGEALERAELNVSPVRAPSEVVV